MAPQSPIVVHILKLGANMRFRSRQFKIVAAGCAFFALAEVNLQAQDFYHGGVSASTVAQAGIYAPTSGNAIDALALNPAGLTKLGGLTVNSILLVGAATGNFTDSTNDHSPMRLRPAAVPIGAVGGPIGHSRFSAGIGIAPDFLSTVHWNYADKPGTGGADYGLQAEESRIVALRGSAGLAFAITPRLSIGATAGLVYNENTLVTPYIFQENPQLAGLKTLVDLHTHGFGWGGSFGITAQPSAKLALTAAYSSPFSINSHGHASGNMGEQFQALNIPFQPDFAYDARVGVKMPQSVIAGGRFQATRTTGISLEGDWADFSHAFNRLPVHLANGTNSDINGFLGSTSIADEVPLSWSDQFTGRVALDHAIGEHYQIAAGFVRRSSLVPNGTLTPLTAAIMKNALSTGIQYDHNHLHFAAAYSINLNQTASVGTSGLLAGEYSQARTTVGTQAVTLELSLRVPPRNAGKN
jgi:long-subunit fatty acid transport protein